MISLLDLPDQQRLVWTQKPVSSRQISIANFFHSLSKSFDRDMRVNVAQPNGAKKFPRAGALLPFAGQVSPLSASIVFHRLNCQVLRFRNKPEARAEQEDLWSPVSFPSITLKSATFMLVLAIERSLF
jgi:hypothetical protein